MRVIVLQTHLVNVGMRMALPTVGVLVIVLHVVVVMGIMRVAVLLPTVRVNVRVHGFVFVAHRYLPILETTLRLDE